MLNNVIPAICFLFGELVEALLFSVGKEASLRKISKAQCHEDVLNFHKSVMYVQKEVTKHYICYKLLDMHLLPYPCYNFLSDVVLIFPVSKPSSP